MTDTVKERKGERQFIAVPERREHKGNPLLALPVGRDGSAMVLGVAKCRAILRYLPEIESFVNDMEDLRIHGR